MRTTILTLSFLLAAGTVQAEPIERAPVVAEVSVVQTRESGLRTVAVQPKSQRHEVAPVAQQASARNVLAIIGGIVVVVALVALFS